MQEGFVPCSSGGGGDGERDWGPEVLILFHFNVTDHMWQVTSTLDSVTLGPGSDITPDLLGSESGLETRSPPGGSCAPWSFRSPGLTGVRPAQPSLWTGARRSVVVPCKTAPGTWQLQGRRCHLCVPSCWHALTWFSGDPCTQVSLPCGYDIEEKTLCSF